jgi:hypothetical protein
LTAFFDEDLLQLIDIERFLFDRMDSMRAGIAGVDSLQASVAAIASRRKVSLMRASRRYPKVHAK